MMNTSDEEQKEKIVKKIKKLKKDTKETFIIWQSQIYHDFAPYIELY